MHLLRAPFLGYFMVVNYFFHTFGATVTEFDTVSVKNFVEVIILRKMLITRPIDLKNICRFLPIKEYLPI